MKPLSLSFEHFGPYRLRQDIDFSALDDFFLIYGKTGSGKTTIFDAIAYALYGEAVGGRSKLERELASRFSEEGSKPWVEFKFFAASSRWKVYRSLPYMRMNRRGKESEAAGEVELYRAKEGGAYELVADRPTTANQALLDLLRLSADEFSKIVLLPQGEFQQFLEMKTTDRVQILEKLFDVGIYDSVTEAAKNKVLRMDASLREKSEELERVSAELGKEPESRIAASEQNLRETDEEIKKAENTTARLGAEIAQKNERLSFWQSFMAAKTQLADMEKEKASFDKLGKKLVAAKALAELDSIGKPVLTLREEIRSVLEKAALSVQSLLELASRKKEIETEAEAVSSLKNDQDALQRKLVLYQEAVTAWRQKAALETARREVEEKVQTLTDLGGVLEQKTNSLKKDISEQEHRLERESEAREKLQRVLLSFETLKGVRSFYGEAEGLEAKLAEILRKIQATEDLLSSNERELAEAERNRAVLEETFRHAQAGLLAATMAQGEPCPVCGSREHPNLAILPDHMPDESSLKTTREEVERLKASRASLGTTDDNLKVILRDHEQRLATTRQKIFDAWPSVSGVGGKVLEFSRDAIEEVTASLLGERQVIESELKSCGDARIAAARMRSELEKVELDRSQFQKEMTEFGVQRAEIETRLRSIAERSGEENPQPLLQKAEDELSALRVAIGDKETRVQRWRDALGTTSAAAGIHLSGLLAKGQGFLGAIHQFFAESEHVDVQDFLCTLDEAESCTESQKPQTVETRQKVGAILSSLSSLKDNLALLGTFAEKTLSVGELAQSLADVFSSHSTDELATFALIENISRTIWPRERVRREEESLSAFRESYATARAAYEVLAARVQPLSSAELEHEEKSLVDACVALAEEKQSLDTATTELRDRRAQQFAELDHLRRLFASAEALKKEYSEAAAQFGRQEKLSKLLSGSLNSQRKMPFKNYVLGLQFQEIAARASERLYRMSGGRYILKADIFGGSGNQKIGLELFVVDAWNGAQRPVGTLSGGEKFMLSISLALGLADSIQERAGAQRIESLFIDEGFGSLDEESLSLAISVLEELRGDKTIAIISHVEELYSRIPSRIVVKKGVSGSHLEFERD